MEVLPTTHFQPDIVLSGWRIGEPVIAFTGLLVAAVCFYAWAKVGRFTGSADDARKLMRLFFLLTGISTVVGALVGHAFLYALPFEFKLPGWMTGMIAVSALQQAAVVRSKFYLPERAGRMLFYANIGLLVIGLWFVSSTLWFPAVEIHAAVGFLLFVAPLEARAWQKNRLPTHRHMLTGVLWLLAAVVVHILKFSLGVWFCFFDIAHVLMCVAMWKFMEGAISPGPSGS